MTKVIAIRHGEPTYDYVEKEGYIGHGCDLAPLSIQGMEQALGVSQDKRLLGSQIIVSSPYTRTLQTAAIISRETRIPLFVNEGLHEWLPDLSFTYSSFEYVEKAMNELKRNGGISSNDPRYNYESLDNVRKRVIEALKLYLEYNKIIIVTHGVVMRQLQYQDEIRHCGIIEFEMNKNFDGYKGPQKIYNIK